MFREGPKVSSKSFSSYTCRKITWVEGTGQSHNTAWLTDVEKAVLRGDSSELLQLVSQWALPMPVVLNSIEDKYTRWEELDVYTAFPSSLVECVTVANKSLPQGQKIRCFAGQISLYFNNLSIPLCHEERTKAAAVLKFWTALDDGPDHCPVSFLMPPMTDYYGRASQYVGNNVERFWASLFLVREQDLAGMYLLDQNHVFPDHTLRSLTRHVLKNGADLPIVRTRIKSILLEADGSRALIACQLIHINCPKSVRFVCKELLQSTESSIKCIIPYLLRRWERQCSFNLPENASLLRFLKDCKQAFCNSLSIKDSHIFGNFENHPDTIWIKLRAFQRMKEPFFADLKLLTQFFEMFVLSHHAEALELCGALISKISSADPDLGSLEILSAFLSSMKSDDREKRIILLNLMVCLVSKSKKEKFWTHWVGLLCVSHDVGDSPLIRSVCEHILSEGLHQCHIAFETLTERSSVDRESLWNVKRVFFTAREKAIRSQLDEIRKKTKFEGIFTDPQIPETACFGLRPQLMAFLRSDRMTLSVTSESLSQKHISELLKILQWQEPNWCRFDQPHEICTENLGYSVACRVKVSESLGRMIFIKKTNKHFLSECRFITSLEEELSWLLLQHSTQKSGTKVAPTCQDLAISH